MHTQPQKQWQEQKHCFVFPVITLLMLITMLLAACGDATPTPTVTPMASTASPTLETSPTLAPTSPATTTQAVAGSATTGPAPAITVTTPSSSETPPPGAVKGTDGRFYYIIDPILSFYKANSWLGLPLGGMREARPDGYNWDGVYQNFQRGRVEAHRDSEGKYTLELGLVNQELLTLKTQNR